MEFGGEIKRLHLAIVSLKKSRLGIRWRWVHVGSKVKWQASAWSSSKQKVEVGQQSIDISEWRSPVVEGGKLGQLFLSEWGKMAKVVIRLVEGTQTTKTIWTFTSWQHCLDILSLAPLKTGWGSVKPRSSSSDRSSAGIGCLQNRKEPYWQLDFSIMSRLCKRKKKGLINSVYLFTACIRKRCLFWHFNPFIKQSLRDFYSHTLAAGSTLDWNTNRRQQDMKV